MDNTPVSVTNLNKYEGLRMKLKEMKETALKKRADLKIAKKNKVRINIEQEKFKELNEKKVTLSEKRIIKTDLSPSIALDKSKNSSQVQSNRTTKEDEKSNTPNKPKDTSDRIEKIKKKKTPKKTKASSDLNTKILREKKTEAKRIERQKIRADPEAYAKMKAYERERSRKRRESGKLKKITEKSPREQQKQRKQWNEANRRFYARKKEEKANKEFNLEQSTKTPTRKELGRKKVLSSRSKTWRALQEKESDLKKTVKRAEKWKKKYLRLKRKFTAQQSLSTPEKNVADILKRGEEQVKKKLLFGEVLVKQMKENASSDSKMQKLAECVSGEVIEKFKMKEETRKIISLHRQKQARKELKIKTKKNVIFKGTRNNSQTISASR